MKFKTSKKIYAHIDCDSFFASCEIFRNPKLETQYVCVGKEIVVAASYNAKAKGVKTGTPIWEAKRMLWGNAVFLSPDMSFYGKLSKKLMNFLREETQEVEVFSVDEAFVEFTWIPESLWLDLYDYTAYLQKKIKQHIWIPVSIGVSNTRIKAKIFSKVNKPYGYFIGHNIDEENKQFQDLPLKDIPFIWKGYQERLKHQAQTIYDFKSLRYWYLKWLIGKNATQLWLELKGVSAMNFKDSWTLKSISRTRSFNKTINSNKDFLWQQIQMNTERMFEELTIRKYELRNITLKLKTKDWKSYGGTIELADYTFDRKLIHNALKTLLDEVYIPYTLYRKTGVYSTDIRPYTPKQLMLSDIQNKRFQKDTQIESVLAELNRKYGKWAVKYWAL